MNKAIVVVAAVVVGSNAGGAIIPVQCVRSAGATIVGNDLSGPVSLSELDNRPYPDFPLDEWDSHASLQRPGPAIVVFGDCDSTLMDGSTVLRASMRAFASVDPSGPGTQLDAVGSASVIFDFTVTGSEPVMIQSMTNCSGTNDPYMDANVAMRRDGQFVAGWDLPNGETIQTLAWEFGPGAWEIVALADVALSTDPGMPTRLGSVEMSLEITSVPAPAGLAVAGLAVLVGARRERGR